MLCRMTFCQIVLDESLMKDVKDNIYNLPWWKEKVDAHRKSFPLDPIPIPFQSVFMPT